LNALFLALVPFFFTPSSAKMRSCASSLFEPPRFTSLSPTPPLGFIRTCSFKPLPLSSRPPNLFDAVSPIDPVLHALPSRVSFVFRFCFTPPTPPRYIDRGDGQTLGTYRDRRNCLFLFSMSNFGPATRSVFWPDPESPLVLGLGVY